jgi:hypothetical protein
VPSKNLLTLKDFITLGGETYYVSTLQMQVRHSWQKEDAKISVYETMVFRAKAEVVDYHDSLFHRRYRTLEDAESGHTQTISALPQIILTCSQCHNKG